MSASALVTLGSVKNATGYKLFWGTASKAYSGSKDIGNNLTYRVGSLSRHKTYYFSAKAYNASGMSAFGNEMSHRT